MFWWGVRWGATAAGLAVYSYCFSHTVTNHVICSMMLEGESMLPTINSAAMPTSCDVVLVGFRRKKRGELKRGDVVVVRQPDSPSMLICKRITALEGDDVMTSANSRHCNTVPRGHVWLEGDNKKASYDSRQFGPLPYSLIHGRVFWRVWPLSRFGQIN